MTSQTFKRFAGTLILLMFSASVTGAQQPSTADLKKDIDALRTALTAIQTDLKEIKELLKARPAAPAPTAAPGAAQNVVLDISNRPFKGTENAKLTLVEFSDYQCPFCERYVRQTYPEILKEYVETGKMKYVFLDFPLESIHKLAFKAAEAARCAGDQGKYWEMHDRLFANQKTIGEWNEHASATGLKLPEFESCLASGKHAAGIRQDLAQGMAAGITGTPGFFIGLTESGSSKLKTVRFIRGAQAYAAFKAQIDAVLAGQ